MRLQKFKDFFKNKKLLKIDSESLHTLISNCDDRETKQILLYISKRIETGSYITKSNLISIEVIENLKNMGFVVEDKDETNEYSEDFENTITILW